MKTKKHFYLGILILVGFIFLMAVGTIQAQRPGNGRHHHRPFFLEQLTEEQRVELQNLRQSMKDQGADRKEIHDAVMAKLEEWGIEVPEHPHIVERLKDQLTEDQINELESMIDEMRSQNADRREICQAVHAKLEEWGIELPERGGMHGHNHRNLFEQLTEEQRYELENLITELKEKGATRQEIRQTIREKLSEWGIKPEKGGRPKDKNRFMDFQRQGKGVQHTNHPNPFNPETTITYELDMPGQVTVSVYNTQGQLIRNLSSEYQDVGQYEVQWNGKSQTGETVPSGVYLYKIQVGNETFTGRMLMMK